MSRALARIGIGRGGGGGGGQDSGHFVPGVTRARNRPAVSLVYAAQICPRYAINKDERLDEVLREWKKYSLHLPKTEFRDNYYVYFEKGITRSITRSFHFRYLSSRELAQRKTNFPIFDNSRRTEGDDERVTRLTEIR